MDIKKLVNTINGKKTEESFNEKEESQPNEIAYDYTPDGIDTSQSIWGDNKENQNSSIPDSNFEDNNEEEYEEYSDDDEYDSPQTGLSPLDVQRPVTTINRYQSIDSEQKAFDVISGINDVPLKYRDENLLPELVMPSIQYNNITTIPERIEWQIEARALLRKHQMYKQEFYLNPRDVAGITYINNLLLWRATRGFERKMSNSNLTGSIEEMISEASPDTGGKKKAMFGGLFSGR